ncbi:hypothetical protein ACFVYG_32430 [Streptomyces sp. NPDC058256]|uniref:hypothetical protein n=1 Tax=Streptomyces sp. NPDC058256 TaxID=3346408 RepID=UPI0036EE2602
MNWAHLLEALLITAIVLPLLLRWFGLLSDTQALAILSGTCTASTVYAFLRGEAGYVAFFAALTVTTLLILRRRRVRARKNTITSRDPKSRP